MKLADSEFRQLTKQPAKPTQPTGRRIKPLKLNPARFDAPDWDRKRGAAIRLTAVLLKEDEVALEQRICESAHTVKTYSGAAEWPGPRVRLPTEMLAPARHRRRPGSPWS